MYNLEQLKQYLKETVREYPHLKSEVLSLWDLCLGEIDDGESEEHEIELCYRDVRELVEKEQNKAKV